LAQYTQDLKAVPRSDDGRLVGSATGICDGTPSKIMLMMRDHWWTLIGLRLTGGKEELSVRVVRGVTEVARFRPNVAEFIGGDAVQLTEMNPQPPYPQLTHVAIPTHVVVPPRQNLDIHVDGWCRAHPYLRTSGEVCVTVEYEVDPRCYCCVGRGETALGYACKVCNGTGSITPAHMGLTGSST